MTTALDSLSFICKHDAANLERAGIVNGKKLLNAAATPEQRNTLAESIGIEEETIFDYAVMVDLLRVRGMETDIAGWLREAGVQSVQELADEDSEVLFEAMGSQEDETQPKLHLTREELVLLIEAACELKPRLVLHQVHEQDFDMKLELQEEHEDKINRIVTRFYILILAVSAVGIILIIMMSHIKTKGESQRRFVDATNVELATVAQKYTDTILRYLETSLLLALITLALVLVTGLLLIQIWGFVQRTLKRRLFQKSIYQNTYLYMEEQDESKRQLFTVFGMLVLIVMMVVLGSLSARLLRDADPISELPLLIWKILPLWLLAIGLILVPDLWHVKVSRQADRALGGAAIQRYLLFRMIGVLAVFIIILVTIQVSIPLYFHGHRYVVEQRYVPELIARFAELDEEMLALELEDEEIKKRNLWFDTLREQVLRETINTMLLRDDASEKGFLLEEILRITSTLIFWAILFFVTAYFIMPFIFIGKPKYAAFALALVIGAYYVENFVTQRIPTWLYLPAGAWSATFTILILVFINNFLFDQFYDELTEEPDNCLFCGLEISEGDRFCAHCGGRQIQPVSSDERG